MQASIGDSLGLGQEGAAPPHSLASSDQPEPGSVTYSPDLLLGSAAQRQPIPVEVSMRVSLPVSITIFQVSSRQLSVSVSCLRQG